MRTRFYIAIIALMLFVTPSAMAGNTWNDSFNRSKKLLEKQVYFDHQRTFYCNATFDDFRNISLPDGFIAKSHEKRAEKLEWEHIVPAENFGKTFIEWREGSAECIDSKGKPFKGRKCAEKVNVDYRHMQADMHNLVPAIGAVNAARSNYNFSLLPGGENAFGTCEVKISANKVEPPSYTRGMIARTYKYMEQEYPQYHIGKAQEKLMDAWDKMYPPDAWECLRAVRIAKIQGNSNAITETRCKETGHNSMLN